MTDTMSTIKWFVIAEISSQSFIALGSGFIGLADTGRKEFQINYQA